MKLKVLDLKKDDDIPHTPSAAFVVYSPNGHPPKAACPPYLGAGLIQVVLFGDFSFLNNLAFGHRVPMTVHIVFRSGGLVVNMVLGYFTGG